MGVPKFYRWMSERYPCLSQVVKDYQIPEFDCLYLDMNGIIHVCSHPNDNDPHFRIKEEEIFSNIFHYIEILFRIIKPQEHFFMAVDGVAPRAKMNQQRGRRFRTAREAEDNVKKALEKGQVLPSDEQFDSNCITPGTEFMGRLQEQLKYFVNMKISTDPLWQQCTIHLSGHDVPGEGEHKIMDFIRHQKSQEGYNHNMRHCLYGLDADLLMLGLSCHEPHFALLREEVRFGKQSKRTQKAEETTFHLLHLSLLREYLDMEFGDLKDKLPFGYDIERVIDDWILMGFLVGNDFVPNLPNLHIDQEALPYLYQVYKDVMPRLDGYLHDGGTIDLQRFQVYLDALAKFDEEKFEDIYCDLKWLESKSGTSQLPGNNSSVMNNSSMVANASFNASNASERLAIVAELYDDNEESLTEQGETTFNGEFEQNKRQYYLEKFNLDVMREENIQTIASEYIRAIQWILHYYFDGCQSWSWFYPYHYAPYISDLKKHKNLSLEYQLSKPFQPFEQLLAVLPAASKQLLPVPFQTLMTSDSSPIIDYYPLDFKTDLNGKRQDWEAVVLVPFIDEKILLKAMEPKYKQLSDEELNRNSYGKGLQYKFSSESNFKLESSYPGVFRDIDVCKAVCETIDMDNFRINKDDIMKGLCPKVEMQSYFCGFPTMSHVKHQCTFTKAGVRVFQQNSRKDNAVICIEGSNFEQENLEVCSNQLLGKTVFVDWPYLVESKVISVFNKSTKYRVNSSGGMEKITMSGKMQDEYKQQVEWIKSFHLERKGINLGRVTILVEATPIKGKRYVSASKGKLKLEKQWASHPMVYATNTLVENLRPLASHEEEGTKFIKDLFPIGSKCFMMAAPHYGCGGEVVEVDQSAGRVKVALNVKAEPDLSFLQEQSSLSSDVTYFPSHAVAKKLGISSYILSRVTGSIFVDKGGSKGSGPTQNIGLKLKFSGKNREVLGYTRRTEQGWLYSGQTIDICREYIEKYPKVFETLASLSQQERFNETQFNFDRTPAKVLAEITAWLENLPCASIARTSCGSSVVQDTTLKKLIQAVDGCNNATIEVVRAKVKPHCLFKHEKQFGSLEPDPMAEFQLLDRVVNVRHSNAVPLGLRGTVIGLIKGGQTATGKEDNKMITYEILFDDTFLGALKGRSPVTRVQFLSSQALLNLSFGERKFGDNRLKFPSKNSANPTVLKPAWTQNASQKSFNSSNSTSTPKHFNASKAPRFNRTSPEPHVKHSNKTQKNLQQNKNKQQNTPTHTKTKHQTSKYSTPTKKQETTPGNGRKANPENESHSQPIHQQSNVTEVDEESSRLLKSLLAIKGDSQHPTNPLASPNFRPPGPTLHSPAAFTAGINQSPQVVTSPYTHHYQNVPSSPVAMDGNPSASATLQNVCLSLNLPTPHYIYSSTGQGVHAVVLIGQLFRCGGAICTNRHEASESAAGIALNALQQPQSQQPPMYPMMGVPFQQQPHFPPMAMPAFPTGMPPPPLAQQQHHQPQKQHPRNTPNRSPSPKASSFVPHQVMVRQKQGKKESTKSHAVTAKPKVQAASTTNEHSKRNVNIVTPKKETQRDSNAKKDSPVTKPESNESKNDETSKQASQRKQRLLAPSFFGAKK